jgi:MutS-like protein
VSGGPPRTVYPARREERGQRAAALRRLDHRISTARLGVALAALVLFLLSLGPDGLSPAWLLLPAGLFLVLVVLHDQVIRRRRRVEESVAYYELGLARLEDRWLGRGTPGDRFRDDAHPFAADLDVFGRGSLFERLCTARTAAGEETLAAWLLQPAPPAEVRARQQAVRELAVKLDLREELALEGTSVRRGVSPSRLTAWGAAAPVPFPPWTRPMALLLAVANVAATILWLVFDKGSGPVSLSLLASAFLVLILRSRVHRVLEALGPSDDLRVLARLLSRAEGEAFEAPRLLALRERLHTEGVPPSVELARFARRMELLESRRNPFFMPLAGLLLWSTQLALALEAWRARCGPRIGDWLAVVGELEALSSLAAFAYENPSHVYPTLLDSGRTFHALGLGHALLPTGRVVTNDLRLDDELRLLVVSGSNMSGKSTLLRSVGTSLVLAFAGAPLRAGSLTVSPLSLGASIRYQDSLPDGVSRFYAEISRLRRIMDEAGQRPPLLFLLDEILHGTNSGDRRVGAEAVVRGLLGRGAVGLITTHDLALAEVAEAMAPRARNVHFEDHLEDGRISFDFRLRDGVVRRSNAIALMRAVGLEV